MINLLVILFQTVWFIVLFVNQLLLFCIVAYSILFDWQCVCQCVFKMFIIVTRIKEYFKDTTTVKTEMDRTRLET